MIVRSAWVESLENTDRKVLHRHYCPVSKQETRLWQWPIGMPGWLVLKVCRTNGILTCGVCDPLREKVSV